MTVSSQPGRYTAWRVVKRFRDRPRYQPPVDCAHTLTFTVHAIDGVRGEFTVCKSCRQVSGVLR